MGWNYRRMNGWIREHGQGEVMSMMEVNEIPAKGSVGKSRGKRKRGLKIPQMPMVFGRKRKNGCRLASSRQINESQPLNYQRPASIPEPIVRPVVRITKPEPAGMSPGKGQIVAGKVQIGSRKVVKDGNIKFVPIFKGE